MLVCVQTVFFHCWIVAVSICYFQLSFGSISKKWSPAPLMGCRHVEVPARLPITDEAEGALDFELDDGESKRNR